MGKIGKIVQLFLLLIVIALTAAPILINMNESSQPVILLEEQSIIRQRFKELKSLDSARLWNAGANWIKENRHGAALSVSGLARLNSIAGVGEYFEKNYEWYNFYSGKRLKISFEIPKKRFYESYIARESIKDFGKYLNRVEDYLINDFLFYKELYLKDKGDLIEFARQFTKFPIVTGDTLTEIAYNVITFVQDLEYIDMDCAYISGDSAFTIDNSQAEHMALRPGTSDGSDGIIDGGLRRVKHEAFSPIELLKHGAGDCDSKTLLAATLLKNLGYDAATMRIHYIENGESSWHSMLGIAGVKNFGDRYFTYKGKKYYFVELTKRNWLIGEITPGQEKFGRMIGIDFPYPKLKWESMLPKNK